MTGSYDSGSGGAVSKRGSRKPQATWAQKKVRHLKFPDGTLIPLAPLPEGRFILHNNQDNCGYRVWIEDGFPTKPHHIRCRCNLGSDLAPEAVPAHHRYPKRGYSVSVAAGK